MALLKSLSLVLSATLVSSMALADSLPEGSFRGKSTLINYTITNPDIVALIIKKEPGTNGSYLAVMGEYDRVPVTVVRKKLALTSWVPRLYTYRIEKLAELQYQMKPLFVSESGEIITKNDVQPDFLTLKKAGTLMGAFVTRFDRKTKGVVESISFDGQVGSTWEKYVPGHYFMSKDDTGGDYLKKGINSEFFSNGTANFFQDEIVGQFSVSERAAGMFTLHPLGENVKGAEKVTGRIGVFIDIVNWKHLGMERFTTDEFLLINPNDASDIGFFYERHAK